MSIEAGSKFVFVGFFFFRSQIWSKLYLCWDLCPQKKENHKHLDLKMGRYQLPLHPLQYKHICTHYITDKKVFVIKLIHIAGWRTHSYEHNLISLEKKNRSQMTLANTHFLKVDEE